MVSDGEAFKSWFCMRHSTNPASFNNPRITTGRGVQIFGSAGSVTLYFCRVCASTVASFVVHPWPPVYAPVRSTRRIDQDNRRAPCEQTAMQVRCGLRRCPAARPFYQDRGKLLGPRNGGRYVAVDKPLLERSACSELLDRNRKWIIARTRRTVLLAARAAIHNFNESAAGSPFTHRSITCRRLWQVFGVPYRPRPGRPQVNIRPFCDSHSRSL
jgi:hypothetical protein